ncbi:MAG: hypothetical protein GY842_16340 [bacterium]|nr:hypothetical protein [bacterium]
MSFARLANVTLVVTFMVAAMPALAINPGTDVVVGAGGSAPGVPPAFWLTDLVIFNPGSEETNVSIYYLRRGADNSSAVPLQLAISAGETLIRPNVVGIDFAEESFGALRVVAGSPVVVNSVTKNNPGGASASDRDAFGQGFPGIPVDNAVSAGETTHIPGLAQTSDQRSNFGVVDVSGVGSSFTVRVLDTNGTELGSADYTLLPWEPFQKNITDVVDGFAAGTLVVEVTNGAVLAYASKVNSGSGDASTLEMHWSCGGGGGRTTSDGTYYFVTQTADGRFSGGGSMTIAGGSVTELCGNLIPLGMDPACGLWLAFCTEGTTSLSDLASGVDMTVDYMSGGAEIGSVSWTATLSISDNLSLAGSLTATGSGWTSSRTSCNGAFPAMTVVGGVE